MPRERKDVEYFGCEFPKAHVELLRSVAAKEDRSVGSLLRIAVAEWIARNSQGSGSARSSPVMSNPREVSTAPIPEAPVLTRLHRSLLRNLRSTVATAAEKLEAV